MRRMPEFQNMPSTFWKQVRYISQNLGYTSKGKRGSDSEILAYTKDEILDLFQTSGYQIDDNEAKLLSDYSFARKRSIEDAKSLLMTADEAKEAYRSVSERIGWEVVPFDPPMNKQTGAKKDVAFLTAIVDLLTFETLSNYVVSFDHDPRSLLEFSDFGGNLVGVSSRRLDGAVPSIANPVIVWEIKEYYYTTTFGSRIADGVYETRLDGLEMAEFYESGASKVEHVLFVDSYSVWWEQGKSYFCRLIDMLNEGSVDEIIFGRETLARWPVLLQEVTEKALSEGRLEPHTSYYSFILDQ